MSNEPPAKTIFFSWSGAGTRQLARADEWSARLTSAGLHVIDHEAFCGYERVIADIARCDGMVAAVSNAAGTWSAIEHDSAAHGRDMLDGSQGSFPRKMILLWFVDPTAVTVSYVRDSPGTRLPDEFEAAIQRAISLFAE